nr:ARID DNA-binding domain-containing protein [Tanacetum cinerariifolium]
MLDELSTSHSFKKKEISKGLLNSIQEKKCKNSHNERKKGLMLFRSAPNKKNKNRGETSKPLFDEKLKYPEIVHVKTDYMVEGSDEQNWNKIWYVGSVYKNHMSPTKSLFKRLKNSFKVLDKEENERKFIFSYGVGEAIVETKDGTLVIPNVYYTPEITMNVLSIEQLENQGYVMTYDRNRCGIRYMFDNEEGMIDAQQDSVMTCKDSTSMVESHNKFLGEYFESIDPTVKCSLIKGIEDLKMEKEDVQDYIDDEYLSMNGTLYTMKEVIQALCLVKDPTRRWLACPTQQAILNHLARGYQYCTNKLTPSVGPKQVGAIRGTSYKLCFVFSYYWEAQIKQKSVVINVSIINVLLCVMFLLPPVWIQYLLMP